jgi:hypothetical protein
MNGHQKTAVSAPKSSGAPLKKHSGRCYESQTGSTSAVRGVAEQDAPKNLITSGSVFRCHVPSVEKARTKDPAFFGAGVKKENGNDRRQPCPTRGRLKNVIPPRGRSLLLGARKGTGTTHGKNEQRPELGIQANK